VESTLPGHGSGVRDEKLSHTVDSLASAHGRIVERLRDAWFDQGIRAPVVDGGADDPELSADLESLHTDMDAAMEKEGDLPEDEASKLADRIRGLEYRVRDAVETQRASGS
jgi:hypothetical protein